MFGFSLDLTMSLLANNEIEIMIPGKNDASLAKDLRRDVFPTPPSPMKTSFIFEEAIFLVPEDSDASKNASMPLLSSNPLNLLSKGFPWISCHARQHNNFNKTPTIENNFLQFSKGIMDRCD